MQQRGEFMGLPGLTVAGLPPPGRAPDTVFIAGIARTSFRPDTAQAFIAVLASPQAEAAKGRHGLEPL